MAFELFILRGFSWAFVLCSIAIMKIHYTGIIVYYVCLRYCSCHRPYAVVAVSIDLLVCLYRIIVADPDLCFWMAAWYYRVFIVWRFCCFVATQSILAGAYLKCRFSISCNCENSSYIYFLDKKSWDFLKMHWTKTISTQLALLFIDLL